MKDLTAFLDPDLTIKLGGRTYTVKPPSLIAGLQLAAINAAGVAAYLATQDSCPSCGRSGTVEMTPENEAILEAVGDKPLGVISLGVDVYDQMVLDEIPEKHIDKAALYALYYWVLGEAVADQVIKATAEQNAGGGAAAAPKAGRTGRSTGSANRTNSASSKTT